MKSTRTRVQGSKLNQTANCKAKSIARRFLDLDEDNFEVEEAYPDSVVKTIRNIVRNETQNGNNKQGVAFLFDIRKENFKNELSDGQNNKDLEFKKRLLKRRAFSPNLQNTYLALSNINFHNDRYQEQPKNIKLKLVRAYIMQREQESKDGNQSNLINESKGGDDIKKN